ncbi:hypothetical protein FDP41_013572 [Naegleria fowleri]|uniref:Protein kinase domain-containing protein n=1 Tax=Naegleria fowleri TaxID=5763 RepID=A0A6A5C3B0_NAEFO|nr:uncharacterized protein FDP41_013572 [Naegleria fowleri]KAF0980358.1 hypothetical protein FDP41_013572 [Naegleria fowleri]CAG4716692.1 unnamed protein product [Naegleria fowleri]
MTEGKQVEHVTYIVAGNKFEIPSRYEVKKVIGQGAYGVVVSAWDKERNENVAIKKIFNIFEHDREYQKRILREVKILRHFDGCENVVQLYNLILPPSFEEFNDVYIVMEFMDSNLRQMIKSNQELTDQNIQYFLYHLLRGLKTIHSANVLHRDIKPSNILINGDMEIKYCDFGLSRGIESDTNPKMSTTYVATRWYRSPELLLMWDQAGKALDIWSLGCIFAEMLDKPPKRRVLFPGKNYLNQLDLILDVTGTPPEEDIRGCAKAKRYMSGLPHKPKQNFKDIFPHANPLAIDLLEKMLAFDPLKRITVEEALKHPYLETMYEEDDEEDGVELFSFNCDNDMPLEKIKELLYEEIVDFNKCHGVNPKPIILNQVFEVKE